MMRFNVKERTLQVRYLYQDISDSLIGWMDDPDSGMGEEVIQRNIINLEKNATIFEIGKTCLLLPAYFWYKHTEVSTKRRNTGLFGGGGYQRKQLSPAGVPGSIFFRMVESVVVATSVKATGGVYTPPLFQVEVNGFWRRLKDGQAGHDPEGKEIEGRTWVRAHTRWQNHPPAPKTIWIKKHLD